MAARAIWKGVIRFDDFQLPVKLYSAVEDKDIRFHLLHDQDMVRVKQRMVNPETNDTVSVDQMQKGFEVKRNLLVLLDDDELASLEPEPSRDIEVIQFVEASAIDHQWYDRPYWLGPDGDEERYFALAEALAGVEGVTRWVMRKKQYRGALYAEGDYLCLVTLRHAEQNISADELEAPGGRKLEKQERELAGKLISALEAEFDPTDYKDEYRDRLLKLIETKRSGGTVEVEEYEEARPPKSLAESLRASLLAMK
jgi:DNA end-binding protein Ku